MAGFKHCRVRKTRKNGSSSGILRGEGDDECSEAVPETASLCCQLLKRKMKPRVLLWTEKLLLRKRAIIETILDQLKNISQIQHSRHRSPTNLAQQARRRY